MVRMTVEWSVLPEESGPIATAVHDLMVAARAEPGCAGCRLTTDLGESAELLYVEEWKDEEALRRQVRSDRFARLAQLVERATGQPLVEFVLPGGVRRGLDYADEVRWGGDSRSSASAASRGVHQGSVVEARGRGADQPTPKAGH